MKVVSWIMAAAMSVSLWTGASAAPTNKQFTIAIHQEFETLNPLIQQMAATIYMYYLVGRPLVAIDADWKWKCYLCTEMPTLENGKAKIIEEAGKKKMLVTWEVDPNATWGDGTPVTAKDIKLSWEIGKSPNVAVGEKEVYERIEDIQLDPKSPKTLVMKFREARYDYYQLGTFYVVPSKIEGPIWERTKNMSGAYEKQTTYATNPTLPGLYAGPYRIDEIKLGSHLILLPNAYWKGHKPAIQRIIFKVIPNTQTLEANLLSGTVDMVCELGMSFDQAVAFEKRLSKDPALSSNFKAIFRQGTIYEHIDLNLRNPVLQDVRVRKALLYSMDRERLVKALFEGKQQVALHDIHPLDPYFTDDVEKYSPDLKKAGSLLDDAGWKMGPDGIRMKNGKKLTFTLMTTAEDKTRELVQVFLQNEWKKVGIEMKIKNEPARVYFGETVRKGKYPDMAMFAWVSSPDNPPRSTVHSGEIPTPKNSYSGQNSGAYSNPKVDKALDEIKAEFNFEKRKALMKIVQQEYAQDAAILPLYMRAELAQVPTNLDGFRVTGHQFYSTLQGEYWALK